MEDKNNQPIDGVNDDIDSKKAANEEEAKSLSGQYYFGYGTDISYTDKVDSVTPSEGENKDEAKSSTPDKGEASPHYFTSGTGDSRGFSDLVKGDRSVTPEYISDLGKHFPIFDERADDSAKKRYKGFGIASMILGIVSVICCCLDGVAIIFAILAIVFSAIRMKVKADGFAIAGLVTGIIGAIFKIVMLLLVILGFTSGIYEESIELIICLLLK